MHSVNFTPPETAYVSSREGGGSKSPPPELLPTPHTISTIFSPRTCSLLETPTYTATPITSTTMNTPISVANEKDVVSSGSNNSESEVGGGEVEVVSG